MQPLRQRTYMDYYAAVVSSIDCTNAVIDPEVSMDARRLDKNLLILSIVFLEILLVFPAHEDPEHWDNISLCLCQHGSILVHLAFWNLNVQMVALNGRGGYCSEVEWVLTTASYKLSNLT